MRIHARPTVEPVAPPAPPQKRRRRVAIAVIATLGVLGVVGGTLYGRQLWSVLTHRKGAPTTTWAIEAFPPGAEPIARIAVAGDVGEGEEEEWQTAWAIRQLSFDDAPYDALLLLGDNVYPDGDPARLEHTVFRPFEIVLEQGPELLAIVGNHDAGFADRQMEVLGMPGTWWTTTIGTDVRVIGLDSNRVDDPAQLAFLEETLRAATEPWRIVAVHEPPYSSGYQGSNMEVRDTFGPLFTRYGVQLVLSGHEHDYQRTDAIDGVTYVISGAAGRTRGTGDGPYTAASWAVLHAVDINVFSDHLSIRAITQDARAFDAFTVSRRPAG